MAITHQATTADACPCCISCIIGALSCRTRGGLAFLCGYQEFFPLSVPAKVYRKYAMTGTFTDASHGLADCSDTPIITTSALSGAAQYNKDNCDFTDDTTAVTTPPGTAVTPQAKISAGTCPFSDCRVTWACTSTQAVGTGNNVCCLSGSNYHNFTGSNTHTLSDEDTEADAITRLLAGAGGIWSAYSTPGVSCVNPPCCKAGYPNRTTGTTFQYNEAQWRITQTGLIPGHNYKVPMQYWRRPYGIGSYTLFQSFFATGSADGGGLFDIQGTVPNARGFETYAAEGNCP